MPKLTLKLVIPLHNYITVEHVVNSNLSHGQILMRHFIFHDFIIS